MSNGFKYWKLAIFKGVNGYFMAIAMAFLAFTDSEEWKTPQMRTLRLVLFCLVAGHKFLDGFFDQTFSLLKSLKEQFDGLDDKNPGQENQPTDKKTEAMKTIKSLFAFSIIALACLLVSGCAITKQQAGFKSEATTFSLAKDGSTNSITVIKSEGQANTQAAAGGDAKTIVDKMRASGGKTASVGASGIQEESTTAGLENALKVLFPNGATALPVKP